MPPPTSRLPRSWHARAATPKRWDIGSSRWSSSSSGARGWPLLRARSGAPRGRASPRAPGAATGAADRPAILVLVAPIIDLGDDEIEQVVRYVRAGGAVLAVGEGGGVTSCAGWRTQQVGFGDSIGVRALETDAQLTATHRVLTVVPV